MYRHDIAIVLDIYAVLIDPYNQFWSECSYDLLASGSPIRCSLDKLRSGIYCECSSDDV